MTLSRDFTWRLYQEPIEVFPGIYDNIEEVLSQLRSTERKNIRL